MSKLKKSVVNVVPSFLFVCLFRHLLTFVMLVIGTSFTFSIFVVQCKLFFAVYWQEFYRINSLECKVWSYLLDIMHRQPLVNYLNTNNEVLKALFIQQLIWVILRLQMKYQEIQISCTISVSPTARKNILYRHIGHKKQHCGRPNIEIKAHTIEAQIFQNNNRRGTEACNVSLCTAQECWTVRHNETDVWWHKGYHGNTMTWESLNPSAK